MTDQDKARINREIAEFLGFQLRPDSSCDEDQWHHPDCKCEATEPEDACGCISGCYWNDGGNPPDFFTDESANALLLDRMLEAGWDLHFGSAKSTGGGIWIRANGGRLAIYPDRCTCTVLAFVEFMKAGGGK